MRAREVVLATGAIERPLVFPNNDRPGVMLADAARRYCSQYGVKVGERAVVAASHDSAYRAALDLKSAGVIVELIADLRGEAAGPLPEAARAAGIEVAAGAEILGVDGRLRVEAVRINLPAGMRTVACDALMMSGGWTPSVHLFSQSRGKLAFDEALQVFKPGASVQRERSAGACNATFDLGGALAEGDAAGRAAAAAAGFAAPEARDYAVADAPLASGGPLDAARHVRADRRAKAFVDFQNDVCATDLDLAVQEGMRSIEHIKRYTTTGMATDQGKLANMNALTIAASALAKPIPEVGLTTFRPPYTPVTFGAFAGPARGDLFDPIRRTPDSRLGGGKRRRVRGCGPVEARLVFSASRRIHGSGGRARVPHDPRKRRPFRRLHARQDRSRRPGRGGVPRAHVREQPCQTRGRALPLRAHVERGRVSHGRRGDRSPRARSLPYHDDDRRRRQRARPHGGLSPDRVRRSQGLADLDDRAMGDDRRAGSEGPRLRRAAGGGNRSCRRGHAAHERTRGARLRRARAAHAGELHRRARLRDQRSRRTSVAPFGRRCGARFKSRVAAFTAPRRCT